jgi:LysR family glycine cleavage system transcriptional activator
MSALRAFEAAARHLSLSKGAAELHVTPSALSHQVRALEQLLGLKLFERRVRSVTLTTEGMQLLPGLQSGFNQIRDAVTALRDRAKTRVLVISTPPGFTSKWLAPRLYRFSTEHPDIDARVSSSVTLANFRMDGVDVAIRSLPVDALSTELVLEKLVDISVVPVCSPRMTRAHGRISKPSGLLQFPLIHDDSVRTMPSWADWFKAAGVADVDLTRGLRFNSADHALDAVIEGAGVLLSYDVLAHDDLRTGRLVTPFDLRLPSGRAYWIVCAKSRQGHPNIIAFRDWIKREIAAMQRARGAPDGHRKGRRLMKAPRRYASR